MLKTDTAILDENQIAELETQLDERTGGLTLMRVVVVRALCQTVPALQDLAYVPKALPDEDSTTYREQSERLLREKTTNNDEVRAVLDALGDNAICVREEGGPEDLYASLAVSVAKLQSRLAQVEQEREEVYGALRELACCCQNRSYPNGRDYADDYHEPLCVRVSALRIRLEKLT